ncbi:MAG: PepSY-like domain-containing protein [Bacteroidota bacterium]
MKTLFLVIASAAIVSFNACSQTSKDVPANLKTAFSKKFPDATKVKWDKENEKEWEAEFKMDGKEYSASFDNNGAWMETEYEISTNEIPAVVKTTIEEEFSGYKIAESEISETADGKVYEFELEKDKVEMEVAIDTNGKIIKKEVKKERDDEGDEENDSEDND